MMELLNEEVNIKCSKCGEILTIYADELEAEVSYYDHGENGMGTEIMYEIRHEFDCPNCGREISFSVTGCEYPEGAFDYSGSEISGGKFVDEPLMGIIYYQDDFEIDEAVIAATGIQKLIIQISNDPNLIYSINPRDFEMVVEQLLIDLGFKTRLTKSTRDGGKDIIATMTGINGKPVVFYVECKRYAKTNKVDVDIVRSLYGVQTSDRVNKVCLVTSSLFTRDAKAFARRQNFMIDLVDGNELQKMIQASAEKYKSKKIRIKI